MHLEDLIVTEKHRGKGIGFALFSKFIKYSHDLNVKRVQWVVLDWNTSAIDFYKKNGAIILDDWRVALMDDKAIQKFVKNEGIFAGYTSGAAFQAVKQLSQENEFKDSDLVVVIFPDHGSRYLSKIYSDKWMENQGFSDSKREINNNDIQYIRK